MKIGLLACSSNTGLGYQTRDFYKHMNPSKTLIYDISKLNGMPTDHSWAFQPRVCEGIPSNADCEWLVDGMDAVFVCETPLNFHLFGYARKSRVKTVLQYNYEFLNYFRDMTLPAPDILAAPSLWEIEKVEELNIAQVVYLPVPVSEVNPKKIKKVKVISHIMGRPAMHDRNGTREFIKMILDKHFLLGKYSDIEFRIYLQTPREPKTVEIYNEVKLDIDKAKHALGERLKVIYDIEDNTQIYRDSDLIVLPRKYGGLCLPFLEALGFGIPVIMTDISPNNKIMPEKWLCQARLQSNFRTHSDIPIYQAIDYSLLIKTLAVIDNIEQENERATSMGHMYSWKQRQLDYDLLFDQITTPGIMEIEPRNMYKGGDYR